MKLAALSRKRTAPVERRFLRMAYECAQGLDGAPDRHFAATLRLPSPDGFCCYRYFTDAMRGMAPTGCRKVLVYAMSQLAVARLEEAGLLEVRRRAVRRRGNRGDARQITHVRCTDEGRRQAAELPPSTTPFEGLPPPSTSPSARRHREEQARRLAQESAPAAPRETCMALCVGDALLIIVDGPSGALLVFQQGGETLTAFVGH